MDSDYQTRMPVQRRTSQLILLFSLSTTCPNRVLRAIDGAASAEPVSACELRPWVLDTAEPMPSAMPHDPESWHCSHHPAPVGPGTGAHPTNRQGRAARVQKYLPVTSTPSPYGIGISICRYIAIYLHCLPVPQLARAAGFRPLCWPARKVGHHPRGRSATRLRHDGTIAARPGHSSPLTSEVRTGMCSHAGLAVRDLARHRLHTAPPCRTQSPRERPPPDLRGPPRSHRPRLAAHCQPDTVGVAAPYPTGGGSTAVVGAAGPRGLPAPRDDHTSARAGGVGIPQAEITT